MGRVKLKIKRLESSNNRQITYSKRRTGIVKKAKELAILCDIDLVLLMFSPTEKPTLFVGERSNLEQVIAKLAQVPAQDRAKRKLESLEALKKTFKKTDHNVNIEGFLGASSQSAEELANQARVVQSRLAEAHKRLSFWSNPDKIDSVECLNQMEDSLRESLNRIHLNKENIAKHQLMSLECSTQLVCKKLSLCHGSLTMILNNSSCRMRQAFFSRGVSSAQRMLLFLVTLASTAMVNRSRWMPFYQLTMLDQNVPALMILQQRAWEYK